MEYNQLLNDFLDKCKKNDITTYNAKLELETNCLTLDNNDFFAFCNANNIHTAFIVKINEPIKTPIDVELIKEVLKDAIQKYLEIRKNYYFLFANIAGDSIAKDYYDSTISETIYEMENEIIEYNNQCNNEEEAICDIIAYITFNSILLSTYVYSIDYENYDITMPLTGNDFLEKYTKKICDRINGKRNEARKQYYELEHKRRDDLIHEIENRIKNDKNLPTLKLKRERTAYADKITTEIHKEIKNQYISKTQIRDLVDSIYFSLL